jgi:2-polyprenyl-6-hydroxyphenyl methylase/3-demethylubiquinone-9 3-methyltransferase
MSGYYTEKLAAERLRACYDVAPPRTRAYLEAEIAFVLARARAAASALELGCGYGRVFDRLLPRVRTLTGVDTSPASLRLARELAGGAPSLHLAVMDGARMGFRGGAFDLTLCIQNGICAFGGDKLALFREAVRVTRSGGRVLFSTYAARFWPDRLEWFEAQSAHGLIGPIDYDATGDGVIVCTDGFRATTIGPESLAGLAAALGLEPRIAEVDGSSLFCEVVVP